jgi:gamma-glutamyltranspeptidase/glutathione hydrolase
MVQVLLGMLEFGLEPQAALERPRAATYNFPASSEPHPYFPGTLRVEGRIPAGTREALRSKGYSVEAWPDWIPTAGAPCVIRVDREKGILLGGADPRRMSYAVGW